MALKLFSQAVFPRVFPTYSKFWGEAGISRGRKAAGNGDVREGKQPEAQSWKLENLTICGCSGWLKGQVAENLIAAAVPADQIPVELA